MSAFSKRVILDIGGVVFEFHPMLTCQALGYGDIMSECNELFEIVPGSSFYLDFEKGKITAGEFKALFEKQMGRKFDMDHFIHAWNACIPHLVPGIEGVVNEFSGKVPFFILSNTNEIHFEYMLRHFQIMKKFETIYTSFKLGWRKPEPEIFEAVAKDIGVADRSNILFIDDLPANVEAAKRAGFTSERCKNSSALVREIISNFLKDS